MSSVPKTRVISAWHNIDAESSPLFTVRLLRAFSEFVESHGWVSFAAISLFCGWIHLKTVASRPLDHDELYTFYIAQAPSLKQLLALTRTVDLHPPLSYVLIRASFAIFGISAWACRLPSVLAFFLASAVLFWLVKRILSSVYATVALLFFLSVPFSYHADRADAGQLVSRHRRLRLYPDVIEPPFHAAGFDRRGIRSSPFARSGGASLLPILCGRSGPILDSPQNRLEALACASSTRHFWDYLLAALAHPLRHFVC